MKTGNIFGRWLRNLTFITAGALSVLSPQQNTSLAQETTVNARVQSKEGKTLDNLLVSEEEKVLRNAEDLSKTIPKEFERETRDNYVIYKDKELTIGNVVGEGGIPQMSGKGRTVIIRGGKDLYTGFFDYTYPGREKGIFIEGEAAGRVWNFVFLKDTETIKPATRQADFDYFTEGSQWWVTETHLGRFKTAVDYAKTFTSISSGERKKNDDLSKIPVRTKKADESKIRKYNEIIGRFMTNYGNVKDSKTNITQISIDDLFIKEEERIFELAKRVGESLHDKNARMDKFPNGLVMYHEPSLVVVGNAYGGNGNFIIRFPKGDLAIGYENTNLRKDIAPNEESIAEAKKEIARIFILTCSGKKIGLTSQNVNITYTFKENVGWIRREINPRRIENSEDKELIEKYISSGEDFKNKDLNKIPVRARIVPAEQLKRYTSLKETIEGAYPLEKAKD